LTTLIHRGVGLLYMTEKRTIKRYLKEIKGSEKEETLSGDSASSSLFLCSFLRIFKKKIKIGK
jgi:hypothetical protein